MAKGFYRPIFEKINYMLKYGLYKLNPEKSLKYFPHYLSVVAIIKNEAPYIAEWIEYHLLVGVTKFYLYDNESEDNLKAVLEPYIKSGIVEYRFCKGTVKQRFAYNDILKKARGETFWLAVIDCDEFIVPISTNTINEFLTDFENYPGVEINWIIYGSGGQKEKKDGLVIERFKSHSLPSFERNRVVKTILNPRQVYKINIHEAVYFDARHSVNINKDETLEYFLKREGFFDKIRINHYFGKSYEEFLLKRDRGIASKPGKKSMEYFTNYDRNEIPDDPIMDNYIPLIYRNMRERQKPTDLSQFINAALFYALFRVPCG